MTAGTAAPLVTLPHGGQLRGLWEQGVRVFRGVPYAQAPRGTLRFAAPVPALPWPGVRDATEFAPMAPQLPRTARADAPILGGEDCLAVNVWAPPAEPGARLPVMVWVHGGGVFRGAASEPLYDGASFARPGGVFVSLQYRLGIDGFLHFEDEAEAGSPGGAAPANRGLLDLLAALQWVREHISAWGGDPAQVTVFGQSAGAGALACVLGMPASRGLLQRAILQSPSVACQTLQEAAAARRAVAALAGVAPSLAALGVAAPPAVLHAVHRLAADPALRQQHGLGIRNFFPLRPVVDGQVLVAPPLQALAQQWAAHPPDLQVLVGCNAEEMRLYHVPGGAMDRVTEAQVLAFAQEVGLGADAVQALRATLPPTHPTPGELLCALQSDFYYRVPAQRIAALASRWARSAHAYEFAWPSPQWRGRLGAAHGVELPFVFGNLHTATGQELTGPRPPTALAATMHKGWVAFAQRGDPGWAPYAGVQPLVQRFDVASPAYAPHPEPVRLSLWDGLL
ncbi:carboxylesterase/lipase family protein [Acidovorax sp. SD340]|uniref:carboxylesterase/lipase family protein n=1 Tax=Acidovorax sp. SD340 TaxID=1690268 RepID=UPI0006DCEF73|nr:carboxylesterase family protein [Acidovorax sp. SD340]KQB59598.1 carboxylesterase [Acidovorax sp. SD340]